MLLRFKNVIFLICCLIGSSLRAQTPVISDFTPKMARPGAVITLTGSGFNPTASNNLVFFGSTRSNVITASASSIQVEVPAGAKADRITVLNTTSNRSGQTGLYFYPTFDGGARIIPASFLPHKDLAIPNSARTIRVADVDGDGWLDIIAASSQEFSIFRNLGTGGTLSAASFSSRIDLDPGVGFLDFGFADLDNDGKQDFYFSQDTNPNGKVGIYRNTSTPGNISFESEILLNATSRISYVAAGDFDGDGRQELLAARAASCGGAGPYLLVYQNLSSPGSLSFASQVDISNITNACTYERIIVTDINGDNKLDIAVQRSFKTAVSVILNQSTPGVIDANTFAPNQLLVRGSSTLALADFNGDDLPEMITHNEGNNTGIALRPNISTPTTIAFNDSIPYFSNIFREGETAISDINGDGKKDVVIAADWDQNWVSILQNDFQGTFDATSFRQPVRLKTNTIYPVTLDIGDLNHDGKPDIVTANQNTFLSILENDSRFPPKITNVSSYQAQIGENITIEGEHFSPVPNENKVRFGAVLANVVTAIPTELVVEVPEGATYEHITVGVGILNASSPRKFSVQSSAGAEINANSFAPPFSIPASTDVTDLLVGDLDNDGKTDLLAKTGSTMFLLKNQSIPDNLQASSFQEITNATSYFIDPGLLIDFNGDAYLDLFGTGRVLFNTSDSGTDPIEFEPQIPLPTFNGPSLITDLSLDGILDHIVTPNSGSVVTINEGLYTTAPFVSGTGLPNSVFTTNINLAKPSAVGTVAVEDFDGDGLPDIAASNPTADQVSFFLNLGIEDVITAMDFSIAQNFDVGDNPNEIKAGDLDLDGKIDLVIVNQSNANSVTVLHNQSTVGNLTFDLYTYAVSAVPALLRLHDLDGDAKPEIITVNAFGALGATFSILKNNTASIDASSFTVEQLYTRANNALPSDFEVADLDDDGRADLIFTSTNPDELVIYKNLIAPAASITIDSEPVDESACEGEDVTFSVAASGTTGITYQWQVDPLTGMFEDVVDGTGTTGATTADLSLFELSVFQSGFRYRCVISGDNAPDALTNEVELTVEALLQIDTQPEPVTVQIGELATFSVIASGNNLVYQWQKDGVDLNGETNPTLQLTSVQLADAGDYSCIVSNSCGGIASLAATLTVEVPVVDFTITNLTDNQTITNGQATPIDFGQTEQKEIEIENIGTSDLSILSISSSDQFFTISNVPTSVGPGLTATFTLAFTASLPDIYTSVITIATSNGAFVFNVQAEIISDGQLIVYNAVAPDGDGKNDFFNLENIPPTNSVQIFNRWGEKVYEARNYDNLLTRFEGMSNVNGSKDLLEGTYFYVIDLPTGRLTGYLYLRR